jgi:hypothetical protein
MLWQDVQIANRNPIHDILMRKNDVGEQERLLPYIIRLVEVDTLVGFYKKLQ